MKVGDLVTDRDAPEGVPTWVGVVTLLDERPDFYTLLGLLCDGPDLSNAATLGQDLRPLTDDEALSVAAWLMVGDPAAEWKIGDRCRLGSVLTLNGSGALHCYSSGLWMVRLPGREMRPHGTAPTDRARRVAASRAFLAHLCTGGQTT